MQVYVRPFPGPDRRWQVSSRGGTQPLWSKNGKEIFYRAENKMMVVDVSGNVDLTLSQPRQLFDQRYVFQNISLANYDVSPDGQQFVMMGTRKGVVKKTDLTAFSNPRAGGINAMGVEDGDAVIAVELSDGGSQVFLGTRNGMAIRFEESDVRAMGRSAYGVRGITLREDDEVVAMEVVKTGGTLLTVAQNGYGKRTVLEEYRLQSRGGVGIINIQTSDRNGKVVGMAYVSEDDEVMLISQQGMILRMKSGDVRVIGRATQGVRLIEMEEGDAVVSVAKLAEREDDPTDAGDSSDASIPNDE